MSISYSSCYFQGLLRGSSKEKSSKFTWPFETGRISCPLTNELPLFTVLMKGKPKWSSLDHMFPLSIIGWIWKKQLSQGKLIN